ncbi:MAG TPA: DUF2252 domain-containing protein [Acidimicrobiales bacterium]|nr:DUF2252 domain-containing protein [Acidimicrobiales bacterium]
MTDVTETRATGAPHAAKTPPKIDHPSAAERQAAGKAARAKVPRASHATFDPPADRPDPVGLLERQATTRVPELVPIRYGRMLVSPFAFYRGAALIMASDLNTTPRTGLAAQLCGDAHASNFGVFGTPERNLVFDVNDFDETLPGPFEWDVKRLAASLAVAGRDRQFSGRDRRKVVLDCVRGYREGMREFAGVRNLDVWYSQVDVNRLTTDLGPQLDPSQRKRAEATLAKARTKDSMQAVDKLTAVVDGRRRIVSDPPLVVPVDELFPESERARGIAEELHLLVRAYRRTLEVDRRHLLETFEMVDMARKVVGVGSVGTRAWIVLLIGKDLDDSLLLQAKEAEASVLEEFVKRSEYPNHGQRVVAGQRLMQASSDIFLGWQRATGLDEVDRDFYIRQLRDWKGSFELEKALPSGLAIYGRVCGWTLARAHARSGDRIAIATYLGRSTVFDEAIADFAETYADQNEKDYEALQRAVADGRLVAKTGL